MYIWLEYYLFLIKLNSIYNICCRWQTSGSVVAGGTVALWWYRGTMVAGDAGALWWHSGSVVAV